METTRLNTIPIACDLAILLASNIYMYTLYTIRSVWLKEIIILEHFVPHVLSELYFLTYHLVKVTMYLISILCTRNSLYFTQKLYLNLLFGACCNI